MDLSNVLLHSDTAEDVASCSNFREVHVKHYHFDFDVNFGDKSIFSVAKLTCMTVKECSEVTLDIHETMVIKSAMIIGTSATLKFTTESFTDYGSILRIILPEAMKLGTEFELLIHYTATESPGVVWLDPVQTAGKKKPYMYSQGQAIMNRSFFPCQDTPAVKGTYSANVKVPEGFSVVMSANKSSFGEVANLSGMTDNFYFEQTVPIPSYLIAIAVGDIKGAEIGPRSTVYAEPSVLEKAKAEFSGIVEEFITTGERLFGPYVWGRYDILIMPPSFPYGGMENPCLTFVTPCLLVGDKSLTDVIIHEISHSWFGNLVTNANWGEFWLNEGFTMFAQRRIMEELYGREYMCLEASVGQALLAEQINAIGKDHPFTCLRVVIEPGVDPDDTYNETPYEKGFCFVSYLQHLVGDVNKFDNFLKDYVDTFKYKCIMAEDTLNYFLNYFPDLKLSGVDKKAGLEFDQWLTKPGWPLFQPDLSKSRTLTEPADQLAEMFLGKEIEIPKEFGSWKTYQIVYFLDKLLEKSPLPEENLQLFVTAFPQIINSPNNEIQMRWGKIVIRNNLESHFSQVRNFLLGQAKKKKVPTATLR